MNLKAYRDRLTKDLERWVAAGWVPAESRDLILADVGEPPAGRSGLWLGMAATVLGGLAIIALVADNWAGIPRALKLGLLLVLFWCAIGAAVTGARQNRAALANGAALIASLVFAASIGLIGQALNIPGDPSMAAFYATLGAGLLMIAGASSGAGLAFLALGSLWYVSGDGRVFDNSISDHLWGRDGIAALLLALAFGTAALIRSRVILHGALLLSGPLLISVLTKYTEIGDGALIASIIWGGIAALAYAAIRAEQEGARTIFGWALWHGLLSFALAGVDRDLVHRIGWIAISLGAIGLSSSVRHGWGSGGAILSLVIACFIVMVDLGVSLSSAAAIFGAAAIIAGLAAFFLRAQRKAGDE